MVETVSSIFQFPVQTTRRLCPLSQLLEGCMCVFEIGSTAGILLVVQDLCKPLW